MPRQRVRSPGLPTAEEATGDACPPKRTESHRPLENADFVVSFCLDQDHRVHTTKILFVKNDESDVWEGWDAARLTGFFQERAALALPTDPISIAERLRLFLEGLEAELISLLQQHEAKAFDIIPVIGSPVVLRCDDQQFAVEWPPALEKALGAELLFDLVQLTSEKVCLRQSANAVSAATVTDEPLPETSAVETEKEASPPEVPLLKVQKLEIWPRQASAPSRLLPQGLAFQAVLSLEGDASSQPLSYAATLFAYSADESPRQQLAVACGEFEADLAKLVLPVKGSLLTPGAYRLEAVVQTNEMTTALAHSKSHWVQVY